MQEQTRSTILQQQFPQGEFSALSPPEKSATTPKYITKNPNRLHLMESNHACYFRCGDNSATTRLVYHWPRRIKLLVASPLLLHFAIVSNRTSDVADWYIAPFRCDAECGRYRA
jgi:hypothetical protein